MQSARRFPPRLSILDALPKKEISHDLPSEFQLAAAFHNTWPDRCVSIEGYSNTVGGSDHVVIVNNTLYNNNTKNQGAEFQIQYHSGNASGNIFENNIVYAGSQKRLDLQLCEILERISRSTCNAELEPLLLPAGYVKGTSITWAGVSNYKTMRHIRRPLAKMPTRRMPILFSTTSIRRRRTWT